MDSISVTGALLFDQLCHDLDLYPEPSGSRFDPFPSGIPVDSEMDAGLYAKYALLIAFLKKTEHESAVDAETETLADFLTADTICGLQSVEAFRSWDGSPTVGFVINEARELIYNALYKGGDPVVTMGSIESAARFGPGRSVGSGRKPTLLYFKVGDSPLTANSEFVRSWYELSVRHNPTCEAAEMARTVREGRASIVDSGTLAFVPKSYKRRRIVVTEPSINTYFQLGLGEVLGGVLQRSFGIDLHDQSTKNSVLARIGSVDGTYATADLKQCSDYISMALVEYLLPPSVVRWIKTLRTDSVKLPSGEIYQLDMCSTMGNGFTFPLQTLILAALVRACYNVLDIKNAAMGVFGDDIALHASAFPLLANVLKELGLVVSLSKSYSSGSFRESCGTDYFNGVNVRGVYCKRYATDQDLMSIFNRLVHWSSTHNIPILGTLSLCAQMVSGPIYLVPPDEPVYAGIRVPNPPSYARFNGDMWEYDAYAPKVSQFSFEPWLVDDVTGRPLKKRTARWIESLRQLCGGSINEPAVLKALLYGCLRRGRIVYRRDGRALRYEKVRRWTPRWGFTPVDDFPRLGSVVFHRYDEILRTVLGIVQDYRT